MIKKNIAILFRILFIIFFNVGNIYSLVNLYDLTIIGPAKFNDGLGRISIGLIDHLKDDLKINYINSRDIYYAKELSVSVLSILRNKKLDLGNVIIYTDMLNKWDKNLLKLNQQKKINQIKLAYSMFESSQIPKSWVTKINNFYDAIIVPDEYLLKSYYESGVTKPIFVLPLGLYLDDFLNNKKINSDEKQFVFGCLASFDQRKNQILLIEAFAKEFVNNKNVILKINGRSFDNEILTKYVKSLKYCNIILTKFNLSWRDYINFMSSLNCYVNISKGEGFSISPREALAMGIPCILTDNTAQSTICKTDYVKVIESNILEKAIYHPELINKNEDTGFFFNCKLNDVRKALREVYNNYNNYKIKAMQATEWVKQYRWQNLKTKYLSLFKPEKIILGNSNEIGENYLMTNSKKLYKKYLTLINT